MATNQNINTDFQVNQEWSNGFTGQLTLTNNGDLVDGWEVEFTAPFEIQGIWGAEIVSHQGDQYIIRADGDPEQNILYSGGNRIISFNADKINAQVVSPNNYSVSDSLPMDNMNDPSGMDNPGNTTVPIMEESPIVESPSNTTVPIVEESPIVESPGNTTTPVSNNNQNEIISDQGITNPQTGQGQFRYGEALQKSFLLYEANRSGALRDDNRLEWRTDSATQDGSDVGRDLTGGYYDAGDHVKFGLPMAATSTMLAWGGVEYKTAYEKAGQLDELLDAVKWGTDYFLNSHVTEGGKTKEFYAQVGDGDADHAFWGRPEDMNMARPSFKVDAANPGSDVAAGTASALASASMLFRGVDDAYADKLLTNAEQLFEFADTYRGKYSDSIPKASPFYTSFSGYADELAEGAAWLYKATGEQKYLDRAEEIFDKEVGYPSDWTWMTDNKSNSAVLLLAQESDDPKYKQMTESWLNSWVEGTGNVQYSQGGMAFRAGWGSLALSSSAAFLAELYNDTVKPDAKYTNFATQQIDYILGDNPRDFSYMIGFGDNYAMQPHHRGASGDSAYGQPNEHILYGALVGGPASANDFDYNDDRNDWFTNEVGTSYNAPLTSALIQQYDDFGGDPLTEQQLDALIGIDANGVGF
jgi:endoglucanase